jgi:hypothetical protein
MLKFIRYPYATEVEAAQSTTATSEVKPIPKPECPIYMEALEAITCVKSCGHIFHFNCIQSWVFTQTGNVKRCPCCRTRMRALRQIDSHGCCISTQCVARMRRASFPAQESPTLVATEQQTRDQMEELELVAQARRAAEVAQVVSFERFEQERREADGRASLTAPEQTVVAGTQQTFLEELGSSIEQARQAAEATEVAEVAEAAAQLGAFERFEQERRDDDRLDEVQRPREWERARQCVK